MSEQIQISELDEQGAVQHEEAAEETAEVLQRFNPWVIALWTTCAASLALFVLATLGARSMYGTFDMPFPRPELGEPPWYSVLAPYSWLFLTMAFLIALSTMLMHAIFWERRNR